MRRDTMATLWLLVAATTCGAVVMAVELLGVRMLSLGYGASQEVWAMMISVTLLSLTVGYFVSGLVADRWPRPALLYGIVVVAGVLVAVCPHLRPVLRACYRAMGLRAGALVSSLAVFFLPLGLLGMVSPFAIKILARRGHVGLAAGGVYAISTVGSVAGTLLTGLWLLEAFGPAVGFRIAAASAVAVGAVGLAISAGRAGAAALLLFVPAVAFAPADGPRPGDRYPTPDGREVTVVAVRDSVYGHITVLDQNDYRLMVVNGIVQTGISKKLERLGKGQHLLENYFQELLAYAADDPVGKEALLIGVAGGLTASVLQKHGIRVEAVDLDPAVIDIARRWFFFRADTVIADGRRFLEDTPRRYDFCVIDTYSGDAFPFYMATVEAFQAARRVLRPEGLLAMNFIGSPAGRPFASVYATLRRVFPHVLALRNSPEDADDVQTITLFASDRPIAFHRGWMDDLGLEDAQRVTEAVERLAVVPSRTDAMVLTDAHSPIDFMRASEALRWRERTLERIGAKALF